MQGLLLIVLRVHSYAPEGLAMDNDTRGGVGRGAPPNLVLVARGHKGMGRPTTVVTVADSPIEADPYGIAGGTNRVRTSGVGRALITTDTRHNTAPTADLRGHAPISYPCPNRPTINKVSSPTRANIARRVNRAATTARR